MNNFTPEDMIRYLYNEMTTAEAQTLTRALEADWSLREKFEVLRQAMSNLDTLHFFFRSQAINAILQYAEATKPVEH